MCVQAVSLCEELSTITKLSKPRCSRHIRTVNSELQCGRILFEYEMVWYKNINKVSNSCTELDIMCIIKLALLFIS
jgi:hypothetical protein